MASVATIQPPAYFIICQEGQREITEIDIELSNAGTHSVKLADTKFGNVNGIYHKAKPF